jgi:hypothetical protein
VNDIVFPSELTTGILSSRKPEETPDDHRWIPAQKFGGGLLYLASRAGSFTDGMVLFNDGGRASIIPTTY